MTGPVALVICIGNELVADDAVGYRVYRQLQQQTVVKDMRLEYCGVGGVALLELLTGAERLLIVVDAVQLGAPVGTLHRIAWDQLPGMAEHAISAHGIGLKDTIAIGKALYPERMPGRILLIGVEGRCFNELGGTMTPEVASAIPGVIAAIYDELSRLKQEEEHE